MTCIHASRAGSRDADERLDGTRHPGVVSETRQSDCAQVPSVVQTEGQIIDEGQVAPADRAVQHVEHVRQCALVCEVPEPDVCDVAAEGAQVEPTCAATTEGWRTGRQQGFRLRRMDPCSPVTSCAPFRCFPSSRTTSW
jgi:hypothetical protein